MTKKKKKIKIKLNISRVVTQSNSTEKDARFLTEELVREAKRRQGSALFTVI